MNNAQKRAVKNYRDRLNKRGLARFEVVGRAGDRDLIRSLARRLAEDDEQADRLREAVNETVTGERRREGGILAALRRSPLVGAEIDMKRSHETGRAVDL